MKRPDARNTTVKLTLAQHKMLDLVLAFNPGAPRPLQHGVAWLIEQAYRRTVPDEIRDTLMLVYEFEHKVSTSV